MKTIKEHLGDKLSIYLLLLTIGVLLLFYSFVYVPKKQNQLNDHAVRILENKARSIHDKYKGYENAVISAPVSYLSKWYFRLHPDERTFYIYDKSKDYSKIYYTNYNQPPYKPITRNDFDTKARVDKNLTPGLDGPDSTNELKSVLKIKRGNAYFVFTPPVQFYEGSKVGSKVSFKQKYPYLWSRITDFTANLKENDFFEDIFLVRSTKNCKDCKTPEIKNETAGFGNYILDHSKLGLVQFTVKDSARNASSGIYEENISGKKYRVFYRLVNLRLGLDVYVVGLVPQDQFNAMARKVSVWFLVFCSLGALILIFLFPVLKLFLLNEHERLSTNDISFGVFSVMLCACLAFILCLGSYLFWGVEMERNDSDTQSLAKDISKTTRAELDTLFHALHHDSIFLHTHIDSVKFKSCLGKSDFNEIFLLETGHGYMKHIFTEKKNIPKLSIFPVSVAERNYYKSIRENNDLDYFIEAINSFASGKSECAISIPVEKSGKNYVGVVTSSLISITQASVPTPYKFVVLDNLGDVKFHSGWNELKSENFLKESEDDRVLKAYLENSITDYVDFTYLHEDCRGYIMPLVKNWSVLVYYQKGNIRSLTSQTFLMCLVSLFIIVLFTMGIHVLVKLCTRKPVLLKTTTFFYAWLNPFTMKSETWMRLFFVNLILLVAEAIGLALLETFVQSLLITLLTITLSYFINCTILKPPGIKIIKTCLGITFILFTIPFLWLTSLWVLVILVIVGIAAWSILKNPTDFMADHNKPAINVLHKTFMAYRAFMMAWLLLIIIGPSFGFLVKHYRYESMLNKYAFIIEDVQKMRAKTTNLNQHGVLYETGPVKKKINNTYNLAACVDSLYYNLFPKFGSSNSEIECLQFSYVPSIENLKLARQDNTIEASSSTNLSGMPIDTLKKQSVLKGPGLHANRPATGSVLLVIGLGIFLWWALTSLTRKIYYIPDHLAWKILSPSKSKWGEIQFEFENKSDNIHILHGANSSLESLPDTPTEKPDAWETEKAILELQSEQKTLYELRWKECSQEEKFFLYDLAEDGVANQSNNELMEHLSQKGLIRLYPSLEIVNASFANFVRSSMEKDDLDKMERLESKDGRWKQVRILLIIVIIAAFAFLSIAEENFLGRATALIGSITLLLPNLLTLFGSLTRLLTRNSTPITNTP